MLKNPTMEIVGSLRTTEFPLDSTVKVVMGGYPIFQKFMWFEDGDDRHRDLKTGTIQLRVSQYGV